MRTLKGLIVFVLFFALHAVAYDFGYRGADGRNGESGQNGRSAQDQTVHAKGQFQYLDLKGSDGSDGYPGQDGRDASNCYQPLYVEYNLYGASGGDGGDGGQGGRGGDGGDALIFFENFSDLAQIQIDNRAGIGGQGSYGGRAGYGCQCRMYSWSVNRCWTQQVCRDERQCHNENCRINEHGRRICEQVCRTQRVCRPERRCRNDYYSCRDGRNGDSGRHYSKASDGRRGSLRLVQGLKSIPHENPRQSVSIVSAAAQNIELTKQIWSTRTDAHSLFHRGSQISSSYSFFERLASASFKIDWKANRSIDDFAKESISTSFDGSSVSMNLSSGIFYEGHSFVDGDEKILVIEKAFRADEIGDLELTRVDGFGRNFSASIEDGQNLSSENSEVKTVIYANVRYKQKLGGWKTVHNGKLDKRYIQMNGNNMFLKLGELPSKKPAEKIYKSKRRVSVELEIERSFGGRVKKVNLSKVDFRL